MKLAGIIHGVLFKEHPQLNSILRYFKELVTLLTKLGLPLCWLTPSGLVIEHNYITFKPKRITTQISKMRVTLNLPINKINSRKQIQGILPYFIHSFNASVSFIRSISSISHSSLYSHKVIAASFSWNKTNRTFFYFIFRV